MIEAIARLRKIADDVEAEARKTDRDRMTRADLFDMAVKWQWLASEAAKLCSKNDVIEEQVSRCATCAEGCPKGTNVIPFKSRKTATR